MRKLKGKYTKAWAAWLVLVGGSFAVIEGLALRSPETGDTLSEHVWRWQESGGSFVYALILGGIAWLLYHFSPLEKGRKRGRLPK